MTPVVANEAKRSRPSSRFWIASSLTLLAMTSALSVTPACAQSLPTGAQPIPDAVWARMQGRSWRRDLPCPSREDLVLLSVPYRDYQGAARTGPMIVARRVAPQVLAAFREIAGSGFRIQQIALIDDYGGDDDASLAANNTSAFNCRTVIGTTKLSDHARGAAIDINPVQNPYVSPREIAPPSGRSFATPAARDAASARGESGLIMSGGVVTRAFARQGWRWGGAWRNERDYQHFYAAR